MLPDRSKKILLLQEEVEVEFPKKSSKKASTNKPVNKTVKQDKPKFLQKLENEEWDLFTVGDWINYFKYKANSYGIRFIRGNVVKESSVIKSLMKKFSPLEIKMMIDFVFDADHTYFDKNKAGITILSGGWTQTIYASAKEWVEGRFVDKSKRYKQQIPQREYRPSKTSEENPPKKRKNRIFI